MLSTLGVAVVAFVSTNIDDIFLLVGFFSDRSFTPTRVVLGQYFGIATLVAISSVCAFISLSVAPAYVGMLGILPILIGAKKLWEAFHSNDEADEKIKVHGGVLSVASVTIANGGDNIGIYTPLFALLSFAEFSATIVVFAIMTAVWCAIGHWFVHHHRFGIHVQHWGHRILPFVLILLGVYILWNSGSLSLFF
jgi:cadmium resistance protein CadD (predicted permease)